MCRRGLYPILILAFVALSFHAKAQLITDSDARLKTAKVEKGGFFSFRKTKKRFDTAPSAGKLGKAATPRTAGRRAFDRTKVKPRYSVGSPFGAEIVRLRPRYSEGKPFEKWQFKVKVRSSTEKPFGNEIVILPTRYSPSKPFQKWQFKVAPRYSPEGSPFVGQRYKAKPRYTITKDFSLKRIWILRNEPLIPMQPTIRRYKGPYPRLRKGQLLAGEIAMNEFKGHKEGSSLRLFAWMNKSKKTFVDGTLYKPKFDKKEREIWNN